MKKKIFSIIFTFIFAATYMLQGVSAYDAAVVMHKRNLNGVQRQSDISNSMFKTVDTSIGSIAAYCLNAGKDAPSDGSILSIANDITSGELLFIINNGYHTNGWYNADIMGAGLSADTAYYATSLAVWLQQGAFPVSKLNTNIPGCAAAIKLYNAAQGQPIETRGDAWTQMAASTYEMSLNGDYYTTVEMWIVGNNQYFTSAPVYIESSSNDYILTRVADGSRFTSGTTLNMGEHWTLSIPANKVTGEMTFKIKWGFNYQINRVFRYLGSEANKQELGIVFPEVSSQSAEAVLHLQPVRKQPTCQEELDAILNATPKDKRTESNTEYVNKIKNLASRYNGFDMEDIDAPSCTPVPRTCQTKLTKLLNKTPENLRVSTNNTYMTSLKKLKEEYPDFDMDDLTNPSCTPVKCEVKLEKLLAKYPESKRISSNSEYVNALKVLASKYNTFDMDDLKNPSCTKVVRMCEDKLRILLEKTPKDKRTESNTEYMNALKSLKNEYSDFDMFDIKNPSCTPVSRTCQEELNKVLSKYSDIERNEKNADYVKELNDLKTKYKEMDISNLSEPSCTPRPPEKILKVRKIDAKTKQDLAGATLQIQKEDGTPVKQWISDGTTAVFTDIEPGNYVLVELSAPEGYVGDGVLHFTLNGDDYSVELEMENSPIPDTADMNFTLIMTAFIVFLGFGIFGLIKAGRREA